MDVTASLNAALTGRYDLQRELGRGGMATVYLARDLRHHRPVALKVLDPELGAVLGVDRFLSEIRVTANLQHPHLLPLFDSGTADGLLYYVMPYIEGESLRARLDREKQLPIDDALRITLAVLAALDYAHGHGIVHRDLKPENILLQHGEPVVADFGIALAVSNAGGARITQTGLSLGTPQYMSPEQATGDRLIDARADIYSMGAMLYEMLSGEPPHTGATVQAIIAKVITERPRSLRIIRDTVPENVDGAVLKALAKLPADRWATAHAFADALRDGTRRAAPPGTGRWDAFRRTTQRVMHSATVWRSIAAGLVLVAAGLAWQAFRPPAQSKTLQLARQLTFDGNVVGVAISPDGGWLAYVSDDCFGKEFTCTHTLQVREVDGTQSVKLVTWPVMGTDLHWSPDGTTIAFVGTPDSAPSSLYLIPRLGGTPQRLNAAASAWTFAPTGQLVLASGAPERQSLLWFDPRTLARTDSAPLPAGLALSGLDFAPDGRRIMAVASAMDLALLLLLDGRGRLLDSASVLEPRRIVRWHGSGDGVFAVVPALGTGDNIMYLPIVRDHIRTDRAQIALGMVQDGVDGIIDMSRTGRLVVLAGPTQYEIRALRLGEAGATWQPVAQRTSWVYPTAFALDGASIVGSATDNIGENVYLFPLAGGAPTRLTSQQGLRDYPFWSADGQHVGYDVFDARTGIMTGTAFIDRSGGRERLMYPGHALGGVIGWDGNDAMVMVRGLTLSVVDTSGALRHTLTVPDSLAWTSKIIADAPTGRVAWWSAAANAVVAADLTRGSLSSVIRTATHVQPVGWGRDGSLFVAAAANSVGAGQGDRKDLVLEKLAPRGSAFVRVTSLVSGCWMGGNGAAIGVIVDASGSFAACSVRRYAPDVWLADLAGNSGWR